MGVVSTTKALNLTSNKSLNGVSSSSTISIPATGSIFQINGTTSITTINGGYANRIITLLFTGTITLSSGNNLKLNGTFSAHANSTLQLLHDGTNWYEVSRSLN